MGQRRDGFRSELDPFDLCFWGMRDGWDVLHLITASTSAVRARDPTIRCLWCPSWIARVDLSVVGVDPLFFELQPPMKGGPSACLEFVV